MIKTFLPVNFTLVGAINEGGLKINFSFEAKYSNINNVKEIIVPKEALEAKETLEVLEEQVKEAEKAQKDTKVDKNEWVREDGKKVIPEFQKVINNFKLIYDEIKNNIKLIDLSEKDGNYIIETKDFKNILKEMNIDGLELELISEASLRYTVDKKTFYPLIQIS